MSETPDELTVLRDVSQRLEAADIPFMLTGSLAMNFYAQPRMTRDIDLIVQLPLVSPGKIARVFEPDYYVSSEGIADAVANATLFNLIHHASVIKVDCIICKRTPYRIEEFSRRRKIIAGGFETWIVTKEDLILSKLCWCAESGSERQLEDVRNLVSTGFDAAYVTCWLNDLGLAQLWHRATSG